MSLTGVLTLAALTANNPGIGNRILALPEFGCIYVKNNKAACSTVTLWLHRAHTGDHEFSPKNVHAENDLPKPRDVGWPKVLAMLSGAAFRFSFVREPVGRAESAYYDKMVRQRLFRTDLQRTLGLPENPNDVPSPEQFVDWLEAHVHQEVMDPHFRPQHMNLMRELVEYDHIGRLENFDADRARIQEATGIPLVPLEVRNVSNRQEGALTSRPDLRRRIESIYAKDLDFYGY